MKIELKSTLSLLLITGSLVSPAAVNTETKLLTGDKNSITSIDTIKTDTWVNVKPFDLEILPPSSGVQFFRDGIVFLSSAKFEGKMADNHISFGKVEARYGVVNETALENKNIFSASSAFPYPCEAITFSSDYNTMYFTRFSNEDRTEKIYKGTFSQGGSDNGTWTLDDSPLGICTDRFTYTHPALSMDGKILVFASNRTGSVGGMDLYASLQKGGAWSEPVNLGDAVNSTSNELYPFLDAENNLFFSSDALNGYGGYDIYVCKFRNNTWERPINLSFPVNTANDDVAFTISKKDGKTAFFTMKQAAGKKSMQLVKISMKEERPDTLLTLSQYFTRPDISQMVILALEPAIQATDRASETATASRGGKDIISYRVQFMTSFNPRTRPQISSGGKDYTVFEYLYSGAYRLCVGEFTDAGLAFDLQGELRKGEYPQATVLAFRNGVLSLDPELLKAPPSSAGAEKKQVSEPVAAVAPVAVKPEPAKSEPVKETIPAPEVKKSEAVKTTVPETAVTKVETSKPPVPAPEAKKDVVVYRVQIATNTTAKGSYTITINNTAYRTFEYNYAGAFRTCVGEFSTLNPAKELQSTCRQAGYPQAFVVAFKNNVRSTDPLLFK
jgi:hypothetical protein